MALLGAVLAVAAAATPANAAKSLSVDDVTAIEPDGTATAPAIFTVTLSKKAARTARASYRTAPLTASGGSDFTHTAGVVRIREGERRASIAVTVQGDDASEGDETFRLLLSDPRRAEIADGKGIGTIEDNDPISASPYGVNDGTVGPGALVAVSGLMVTAVSASGNTVWAAWQEGDPGFNTLIGSGIKIDVSGAGLPTPPAVGDRIDVEGRVAAGRVLDAADVATAGTGGVPAVTEVAPNQLNNDYDRVLIRITGLTYTSSVAGGEWQTTQGPRVRPGIISSLPNYEQGKNFASITGIGDLIGTNFDGVMPRANADFVGIPRLAGFSLDGNCVQTGATGDVVGTVSLDEPAQNDTVIAVASGDPNVASVPGAGVTIAAGQTSAPVTVNTVAAGAVDLTASLGAAQLVQTLTVFESCEPPR